MTTEDRVRKIIVKLLNVNPNNVTLRSDLLTDLGADSVDRVELIMYIEDEFKITVPDSAECSLRSVQDLVNFIEKKIE